MTVKNVLDNLPKKEKATIMYAFENDLTQFVEYTEGKFIGVNTDCVKMLKPEVKTGPWRLGIICKY